MGDDMVLMLGAHQSRCIHASDMADIACKVGGMELQGYRGCSAAPGVQPAADAHPQVRGSCDGHRICSKDRLHHSITYIQACATLPASL